MKNKIDEYFRLQEEIYKYFGYIEDWCVYPIDDRRKMYWFFDSENDTVEYSDVKENVGKGEGYSDEVYTNRFLKKWIYRKEEYTMILVDTHCDGNKFLAIYDNEKIIVKQ